MELPKYKEILWSIFKDSGRTEKQIEEVVNTVLNDNNNNNFSFENNVEIMTLFLLESEDSCFIGSKKKSEDINDIVSSNNIVNEDDLEGAVGFGYSSEKKLSLSEINSLLHIFPDICPDYLNRFCQLYSDWDFDDIVDKLAETDYKRKKKDADILWNDLKQMLPNADPIYLRNQARVLANKSAQDLEEFLQNALDNHDYPTMQNYLITKEKNKEVALYTKNFTVGKFLEIIPNPVEFFFNGERKPTLSKDTADKDDEDFALNFLCNQFVYLRQLDIKKAFSQQDMHLIKTYNKLKFLPKAFRNPRKLIQPSKECQNIDLLQEIAFLKHEKQIRQFIKMKNDKYCEALEEAEKYGLLRTCACCFDDQLIPEECLFCNKDCTFCKNCVKLGAEHAIGEGKIRFPCLANCDSEFDYSVLRMALDKKVFQRLCQRRQIEEIKNANIDGLETCPFCDFSMIPAEGDKIFKCENIECMKESCRECRHISHIPLRCNEIEYDEDVKMRTYIENKMTEALLRECWKCSRKFYKESGCNKMTCLCGARMCYICKQPVNDYSHFNSGSCPLYTENLQEFHLDTVLKGAQSAKNELGINTDPNKLKFDPTKNIEKYVQ